MWLHILHCHLCYFEHPCFFLLFNKRICYSMSIKTRLNANLILVSLWYTVQPADRKCIQSEISYTFLSSCQSIYFITRIMGFALLNVLRTQRVEIKMLLSVIMVVMWTYYLLYMCFVYVLFFYIKDYFNFIWTALCFLTTRGQHYIFVYPLMLRDNIYSWGTLRITIFVVNESFVINKLLHVKVT